MHPFSVRPFHRRGDHGTFAGNGQLTDDPAAETELALEALAHPLGRKPSVEGEHVIIFPAGRKPFITVVHTDSQIGAGISFPLVTLDLPVRAAPVGRLE